MKDYKNKGHPSKLSIEELKQTPSYTNYIPHHGIKNANKSCKLRVVFDARAKFQSTFLNENIFKEPDLLNSLIGVLIRFWKEETAFSGNAIRFMLWVHDALHFYGVNSSYI